MEVWFVWLARLMFVGIFPLAIGMFYRAWAIAIRKDYRHVADWRGKVIPNGERWAPLVFSINFLAGGSLLGTGILVLLIGLPFVVWSSVVAFVIWSYYFLLRVIVFRAARQTP
jgi:hypothetical protein